MTNRTSVPSAAIVAVAVLVSLAIGSSSFADVRFSVHGGRVSIVATDATVAEILAEWARVGQTKIVGTERIAPDRMTLVLQNVSEQEALDIVLRMVGGYLAAWRAVDFPNASSFARIVVVPRGAMPVVATLAPPASKLPAYQPPADPPPQVVPAQPADDRDDGPGEQPSGTIAGAVAAPEPRTQDSFKARHALEVADPREFQVPAAVPGGVNNVRAGARPSGGVAVPGQVVQPNPPPPRPPVPRQPS